MAPIFKSRFQVKSSARVRQDVDRLSIMFLLVSFIFFWTRKRWYNKWMTGKECLAQEFDTWQESGRGANDLAVSSNDH